MTHPMHKIFHVLLIVGLLVAPLHMAVASATMAVGQSSLCHDEVSVQSAGQADDMVMQQSQDSSCHADSHCCAAVFATQATLTITAGQSPFSCRLPVTDYVVPLSAKPPRFTE